MDKYKVFKAFDICISEEGLLMIFLIRLTFIPYGLSCYIFGLTKVTFIDYILGTFGMVFHVTMWTFFATPPWMIMASL